jgi:purine nucleoside phosphorylase
MTSHEINHSEVMEIGAKTGRKLAELILRIIPRAI